MKFGVIVLLAVPAIMILRDIWSWFTYYGWKKGSNPDPNARVLNIETTKFGFLFFRKSTFRNRVEFSDGFWYTTYKCETSVNGRRWTFFVDKDLKLRILDMAVEKHDLAVRKKLGQDTTRTRPSFLDPEREAEKERSEAPRDMLTRHPSVKRYASVRQREKRGQLTVYTLAYQKYDGPFACRCVKGLKGHLVEKMTVSALEIDGTRSDVTHILGTMVDTDKPLVATVITGRRNIVVELRPGTDTIWVIARQDISEKDILVLIDWAIGNAV